MNNKNWDEAVMFFFFKFVMFFLDVISTDVFHHYFKNSFGDRFGRNKKHTLIRTNVKYKNYESNYAPTFISE